MAAKKRSPKRGGTRSPKATRKRVRYAVVGQGYISQVAVLPAFEHAKENSELVALVSDDATKLRKLGKTYGVDRLTDYDGYDALMRSGEVDAVYVALPNTMHRDFTVRAADAGVHVLCEKPMATTSEDCEAMIEAARRARVKLMVAYRLHFEKANLSAVEIATSKKIGAPRYYTAMFSMQAKEGGIRLQRRLGGGTLWDIGIYCLNAARALFRAEPEEVVAFTANNGEKRFREVDEMTGALLRFPGERLATFVSSFGAADVAAYTVVGTKGSLCVDPAFEFAGELGYELTVGDRTTVREFPRRDQFAPELVHFSDCVLRDRDPEPSGREGLADVRVIEALYASASSGKPVRLAPFDRARRPEPSQEMRKAPVEKPDLVRVEVPFRE